MEVLKELGAGEGLNLVHSRLAGRAQHGHHLHAGHRWLRLQGVRLTLNLNSLAFGHEC